MKTGTKVLCSRTTSKDLKPVRPALLSFWGHEVWNPLSAHSLTHTHSQLANQRGSEPQREALESLVITWLEISRSSRHWGLIKCYLGIWENGKMGRATCESEAAQRSNNFHFPRRGFLVVWFSQRFSSARGQRIMARVLFLVSITLDWRWPGTGGWPWHDDYDSDDSDDSEGWPVRRLVESINGTSNCPAITTMGPFNQRA